MVTKFDAADEQFLPLSNPCYLARLREHFLPTVAAQQSELQRLIGFSDQMTGLTVDELLPQAAVSLAVLLIPFSETRKFQPIRLASWR